MSRLKSYDIFAKPEPVLRRISIIRNGIWTFATIPATSFVRETKSQRFYLINEVFGLCRFNQIDPRKTSVRGKNGDYIAADPNGNLTLVTAKEFSRKFPKAAPSGMAAPLTSDDFIRESSEELSTATSNRTTNNSTFTGGISNARPTTTRPSY